MMKTLLLLVIFCIGGALSAEAATLIWDRNSETDMLDYKVRQCSTAGCVVALTDPVIATVLQTATGVKPSIAVTPVGAGAYAVTARDISLNESGLSVQLPFDKQAPSIPANLTLQ